MENNKEQFDYTTALERVNDQLVVTLKYCVELPAEFRFMSPDPDGWQDMIDNFTEVLETAESVRDNKTLH